MKNTRHYLDNSATTSLDARVIFAMHQFEKKYYGNPSSIHREGQEARARIDFARASIAQFFGAKSQEIIYTSGATESNNLAIQGVVDYHLRHKKTRPHIITTELEHHSVYNVVKQLKARGAVEATFVKPNRNGLITPDKILKNVRTNTVLISVIFVSNEIGSVLPIREIGKLLTIHNSQLKSKVLFHTDAVQAVKFYNCNVDKLGVDLLTFSAHKIHGPKGIGGLFVKTGTKLEALMHGGSQEYDLRPGTQNTIGIIGMAKAYELLGSLDDRQKNAEKIKKIQKLFLTSLLKNNRVILNGPTGDDRAPDNLSVSIKGIDSDTLIAKLDLAGIAASTGSACVSGSTEPSHVIKALGKPDRRAAVLRLSLDIDSKFVKIL
ncbi:MAG: cysteine desulfurase [Candidatus Doudnabacteria bacterium]|nr:cysteine desulfurase [Candidatus Doudnabacteria bacterium]